MTFGENRSSVDNLLQLKSGKLMISESPNFFYLFNKFGRNLKRYITSHQSIMFYYQLTPSSLQSESGQFNDIGLLFINCLEILVFLDRNPSKSYSCLSKYKKNQTFLQCPMSFYTSTIRILMETGLYLYFINDNLISSIFHKYF